MPVCCSAAYPIVAPRASEIRYRFLVSKPNTSPISNRCVTNTCEWPVRSSPEVVARAHRASSPDMRPPAPSGDAAGAAHSNFR